MIALVFVMKRAVAIKIVKWFMKEVGMMTMKMTMKVGGGCRWET